MAQSTLASAPDWAVKTVQALESVVGGAHPNAVQTEQYGTARAIEQSSALSGIKVNTSGDARPTGSSNREVVVEYVKRNFPTADGGRYDWTCNDPAATPETKGFDKTTVEEVCRRTWSVAPRQYDDLSYQEVTEDIVEKMYTNVLSAYRQYNNRLAEKMMAAAGNYFLETTSPAGTPVSSLTNPQDLKIFTAEAVTKPQPLGLHQAMFQYKRMGVEELPIYMVGGNSKWDAYMEAMNLFAGSFEEGRDGRKSSFNARGFTDYYIDLYGNENDIGGVTDLNRLITFVPGTFKALDWYELMNPLKKTIVSEGSTIGQVFAPLQSSPTLYRGVMDLGTAILGTPFLMDVEIRLVECDGPGGKVVYNIQKDYDLWVIPQDAFNTSYNQYHNYCLQWNLTGANLAFADL